MLNILKHNLINRTQKYLKITLSVLFYNLYSVNYDILVYVEDIFFIQSQLRTVILVKIELNIYIFLIDATY